MTSEADERHRQSTQQRTEWRELDNGGRILTGEARDLALTIRDRHKHDHPMPPEPYRQWLDTQAHASAIDEDDDAYNAEKACHLDYAERYIARLGRTS